MPFAILRHVPCLGQKGQAWAFKVNELEPRVVREEIFRKHAFAPIAAVYGKDELVIESVVALSYTKINVEKSLAYAEQSRTLFGRVFLVMARYDGHFEVRGKDGSLQRVDEALLARLAEEEKLEDASHVNDKIDTLVVGVAPEKIRKAVMHYTNDENDWSVFLIFSGADEASAQKEANAWAERLDGALNKLVFEQKMSMFEAFSQIPVDPQNRFYLQRKTPAQE